MAQQDIVNFLDKNTHKSFNAKEVSEQLGISNGSVTMSFKRIRKAKFANYKKVKINGKDRYTYWSLNRK